MSRTGAHLKVRRYGTDTLGVELEGLRAKPEPIYFKVKFPGGEATVVRTADDDYWVHVTVDHDPAARPIAAFSDARLDFRGLHAGEGDLGDFGRDDLYHVAFRVTGRAS